MLQRECSANFIRIIQQTGKRRHDIYNGFVHCENIDILVSLKCTQNQAYISENEEFINVSVKIGEKIA